MKAPNMVPSELGDVPSILLKLQKGLSISVKERPFFRQESSTSGVRRTMTTGDISSSSILPSVVFAGSTIAIGPIPVGEKTNLGNSLTQTLGSDRDWVDSFVNDFWYEKAELRS